MAAGTVREYRIVATSRDDLLYRSSFDPATLKRMAETFDEAWASVESDFVRAPQQEVEALRTALAQAILEVTSEGYSDPAVIKRAAQGAIGSLARPSDTRKLE